jgi:hypothetical protein
MKQFLILFLTFFSCLLLHPGLRAQDSATTSKTATQTAIGNVPAQAAIGTSSPQTAAAAVPKPENAFHDYGTWLLTLLPVILAVSAFSFFLSWLKRENYNLSDALSGCDPVTLVNKTTTSMTPPVPASPAPPATQQPAAIPGQSTEVASSTDVLPRSTSRLIAFLTGITAIICALSFLSLFIYAHLSGTDGQLQFDGIWKIMAGLGVGTIPYGFNMWKERAGNNQSQ